VPGAGRIADYRSKVHDAVNSFENFVQIVYFSHVSFLKIEISSVEQLEHGLAAKHKIIDYPHPEVVFQEQSHEYAADVPGAAAD
jgi:hypothetical protein